MMPISAILDERLVGERPAAHDAQTGPRDRALIRAFRSDGTLALSYIAASPNPFAESGDIISYADRYGHEYWIDEKLGILLHMAPQAHFDPPTREVGLAERLPVAELRERAMRFLERGMRGFREARSSLHPLEGNRRKNVYYFRWEDYGEPMAESDIAPFAQVALYADGMLAAYTNTLAYGRLRELALGSDR